AATPNSVPANPLAPRQPHFAPRAKSVIFLFMYGGPSHVDTFDYKPRLYELDGQMVPVRTHGRGGAPHPRPGGRAEVALPAVRAVRQAHQRSVSAPGDLRG